MEKYVQKSSIYSLYFVTLCVSCGQSKFTHTQEKNEPTQAEPVVDSDSQIGRSQPAITIVDGDNPQTSAVFSSGILPASTKFSINKTEMPQEFKIPELTDVSDPVDVRATNLKNESLKEFGVEFTLFISLHKMSALKEYAFRTRETEQELCVLAKSGSSLFVWRRSGFEYSPQV